MNTVMVVVVSGTKAMGLMVMRSFCCLDDGCLDCSASTAAGQARHHAGFCGVGFGGVTHGG